MQMDSMGCEESDYSEWNTYDEIEKEQLLKDAAGPAKKDHLGYDDLVKSAYATIPTKLINATWSRIFAAMILLLCIGALALFKFYF